MYIELLLASDWCVEVDYAESVLTGAILKESNPQTMTLDDFVGCRLTTPCGLQCVPSAALPWAFEGLDAYLFDIKACFAQILADIKEDNSPIALYAADSDAWRQRAADHYGCNVKIAKLLYSSLLGGGREYDWRRAHGLTGNYIAQRNIIVPFCIGIDSSPVLLQPFCFDSLWTLGGRVTPGKFSGVQWN